MIFEGINDGFVFLGVAVVVMFIIGFILSFVVGRKKEKGNEKERM